MERTISKLNRQINHKLTGIHDYEAININSRLGGLLDCYDIPENAKLACLTIDTSMKHLDEITQNQKSKKSILIGDLLSAHFYTLLAEINDSTFQLAMSKAIVKSNEDIYDAIIEIETIFPYITLSHFSKEQVTPLNLYQKLIPEVDDYYPPYLKMYQAADVHQFLKDINQSYIEKSRGNIND